MLLPDAAAPLLLAGPPALCSFPAFPTHLLIILLPYLTAFPCLLR